MPFWMKNYVDLPAFYRNAEGNEGGSGEQETSSDNTNETAADSAAVIKKEDLDKIVEKAVAEAVAGLKRKNDEVIGANKKLKDQLAALSTKPSLTDEEYAEFKSLKERIERDELLKALTEGKSEEVIEKVTRKTKLDYEAKLAAEAEAKKAAEDRAATTLRQLEQTVVNMEITKAAAGAVKPQYQDLIARLVGDKVKVIDGAVRVVDADGNIEMTANGAKPLTVSDLIETLRGNYADLFVASSGGGAGGSGGKPPSTSKKISMDAAGNMSFEEYAKARSAGLI